VGGGSCQRMSCISLVQGKRWSAGDNGWDKPPFQGQKKKGEPKKKVGSKYQEKKSIPAGHHQRRGGSHLSNQTVPPGGKHQGQQGLSFPDSILQGGGGWGWGVESLIILGGP